VKYALTKTKVAQSTRKYVSRLKIEIALYCMDVIREKVKLGFLVYLITVKVAQKHLLLK